jgi:hypothetical protein
MDTTDRSQLPRPLREALDRAITVRWTPGKPFAINGCIPLDGIVGNTSWCDVRLDQDIIGRQ